MSDNYIKEVLKKKGYSLASIAEKLGMGKQNFGQQLERSPSFELIKRISQLTGISLDELSGKQETTMEGKEITIDGITYTLVKK